MARDQIVSDWVSVQSESRESPSRGEVLTGAFILAFIVVGDIESLAKAGSVLLLILYGLLNISLVVFRKANLPEDEYNPDFTVPLYPIVPIVGVILSFGLIGFMGPIEIALSIAFIVVFIVWYYIYTRQRLHEDETGILQKYVLD